MRAFDTTSSTPPALPTQRTRPRGAQALRALPARAVHGQHCGCCAPWSIAMASLATLDVHADRILALAAQSAPTGTVAP